MGFKFVVYGDKSLIKRMNEIGKTKALAALRKGLRAGAKEGLPSVRDAIPVKTGEGRQSFKVRATARSRTSVGVKITSQTEDSLGVKFGELGTKYETAKHWVRNAIRKVENRMVKTILDTINEWIFK